MESFPFYTHPHSIERLLDIESRESVLENEIKIERLRQANHMVS